MDCLCRSNVNYTSIIYDIMFSLDALQRVVDANFKSLGAELRQIDRDAHVGRSRCASGRESGMKGARTNLFGEGRG